MEQELMEGSESAPLTKEQIIAQARTIQDVMRAVMKDGEHYGVVPGCGDKPTLLKPGAEKLLRTFGFSPRCHVASMFPGDDERVGYRVECEILSRDGRFLGMGVGEASSEEKKWKWRRAVCQEEWDEAMDDHRQKKWKHGGQFELQVKTNPFDLSNCVTPETRILTHDLRWVPAGDILTGDKLIGVEEHMSDQYARNLAIGEATVCGTKEDTVFEVTFEDGRSVRCNGEHRWLVKKVGLKGTEWVPTLGMYEEILARQGRPRHWSVMSLCRPWEEDLSREGGYLAGLLDADGSFNATPTMTTFAQQANKVLDRLEAGLEARGFAFGKGSYMNAAQLEQRVSQERCYTLIVRGGFAEQMRLLGTLRPPRLLERWLTLLDLSQRRLEGRGSGAGRPMRITGIEIVGTEEIVMLGSSCGTYIAEGFVAHNTILKMAKKRAQVDATLTVCACSDIFSQDLEEIAGSIQKGPAPPNQAYAVVAPKWGKFPGQPLTEVDDEWLQKYGNFAVDALDIGEKETIPKDADAATKKQIMAHNAAIEKKIKFKAQNEKLFEAINAEVERRKVEATHEES